MWQVQSTLNACTCCENFLQRQCCTKEHAPPRHHQNAATKTIKNTIHNAPPKNTNRIPPTPPTDLTGSNSFAVAHGANEIGQCDISPLDTQVSAGAKCLIYTDTHKLYIIVYNLIYNLYTYPSMGSPNICHHGAEVVPADKAEEDTWTTRLCGAVGVSFVFFFGRKGSIAKTR